MESNQCFSMYTRINPLRRVSFCCVKQALTKRGAESRCADQKTAHRLYCVKEARREWRVSFCLLLAWDNQPEQLHQVIPQPA